MECDQYGYFGRLPNSLCPLGQSVFGVKTETSGAQYWLIETSGDRDKWLYIGPEKGFLQHRGLEQHKKWLLQLADEKWGPIPAIDHSQKGWYELFQKHRRDIDLWALAVSLMDLVWVQGSYGAFTGPESGRKYQQVKNNLSPLYGDVLMSDKTNGQLLQIAIAYLEDEALAGETEFLYGLYSPWFQDRNCNVFEQLTQITDRL